MSDLTIEQYSQGEMTPFQKQCFNEVKQWIQGVTEFKGRSDDKYLLIFIHGSKFNVDKVKKKLAMYYECRRKFPKWMANKDLRDNAIISLLQQKMTTAIVDRDEYEPTVVVSKIGRAGPNPDTFDNIIKLHSIILETVLRRPNFQTNGVVWIIDCKDYPLWLIPKALNPFLMRDFLTCFITSSAVKFKGVHVLNSPGISVGIWGVISPFVPGKMKDRVYFYGSDWPGLFDQVAVETIPEEYGGQLKHLAQEDDAFVKEVLSLQDYFMDDNRYGFST